MLTVKVYCAVSLDGFIAGVDDDLSWLDPPESPADGAAPARGESTIAFDEFMARTQALLMGRKTLDVLAGFDVPWPYGETPIFVATQRQLPGGLPETVQAVHGEIGSLCQQASMGGQDGHIYLDGGSLITQALEADLIEEMILSVVPVLLGEGVPLYSGRVLQRFTAQQLGHYAGTHQMRLTRWRSAAR